MTHDSGTTGLEDGPDRFVDLLEWLIGLNGDLDGITRVIRVDTLRKWREGNYPKRRSTGAVAAVDRWARDTYPGLYPPAWAPGGLIEAAQPALSREPVLDAAMRSAYLQQELPGHVFISYVREDSHEVDRLQRAFDLAGIRVWRDTADLWPGEDWRTKIRNAITDNALVFIACFSRQSVAREKSYQNEELVLAIEQLRLRHPEDPWLIPIRFDDCQIPDRDIGGGRTLTSIQRADLFGERNDEDTARLLASVRRILERRSANSAVLNKASPSSSDREARTRIELSPRVQELERQPREPSGPGIEASPILTNSGKKQFDVYFSFHFYDRAKIFQIALRLRRHGLMPYFGTFADMWVDPVGFIPEEEPVDWQEITEAICQSSTFCFCASHYTPDEYHLKEIETYFQCKRKKKVIIPIWLTELASRESLERWELPTDVTTSSLDFSSGITDQNIDRLAELIRKSAGSLPAN
jgi:hypothetical protein